MSESDTPHLDALSTLSERPGRPVPKPVPRLVSRTTKQRDEDKQWKAVCRYVDERDRFRCRCCGRRLVRTLTLCEERLEHHHLEARSLMPELVHDVRNVIAVCKACHDKLTRHEIEPMGTERFSFGSGTYLNADCPLVFVKG
jgi:5-methylcytosine-specific restriction endonuclease McrA